MNRTTKKSGIKENGSVMIFIAILLPVVMYISFSANQRGKVDLRMQGDLMEQMNLSHFADSAIAQVLEDGEQISDAIAASKGVGNEDVWQDKNFFVDASSKIRAFTSVQATQLPASNTSANQLTVYLVTIKARVVHQDTTLESETQQHLVEMGIP